MILHLYLSFFDLIKSSSLIIFIPQCLHFLDFVNMSFLQFGHSALNISILLLLLFSNKIKGNILFCHFFSDNTSLLWRHIYFSFALLWTYSPRHGSDAAYSNSFIVSRLFIPSLMKYFIAQSNLSLGENEYPARLINSIDSI